ncbi:MAG TPA: glycosyltransferase, partial [Desulfobacterales bacterium]|nr:glycosyltransferase [Desulfobacterales bacterium]
MKKIAVITPVYNGEKFIEDCLKSVALSITTNNFDIEHILVDDCSTDKSWEIINRVNVPKLRTFRLEKNSGSSAARNFGIKQSSADYLFCLDQDDVLFQNSLKFLFETTGKHKTDWVYGDFLRTNEDLKYIFGEDYYGSEFISNTDLLTSMFSGEHFFQQNCFYSRELFESVGGFDENNNIYQDFDLFTRFALSGHLPKYIYGPLYLHRFHKNNLSKVADRENNPEIHKKDVATLYA